MGLKFVIQKHDASHLHYDLRLELDGVARSWALPKEPVWEMGMKRLAVQVEDHDVLYMKFEGEIARGEYGAGSVEIWDSGEWVPESVKDDKIVGELKGKRLSGRFTLLRFRDKNWLFFRAKER